MPQNPIAQMLGKANPTMSQPNNKNSFSQLVQIANAMRSNNSEQLLQSMIETNPHLKAFVNSNQGKSIEQICRENGLNVSNVKSTLSMLGF